MVMTVKPVRGGEIKVSRVIGTKPLVVRPTHVAETSVRVIFNGPPGRTGATTATKWAQAEW